LQLVPPWAANFMKIFTQSRASEGSEQTASLILNGLLDITKLCCSSPMMFEGLEAMWHNAFTAEGANDETVKFLVDTLVFSCVASELAEDDTGKDSCALCLLFLCRTPFSKTVWKCLSDHWTSFPEIALDGSGALATAVISEHHSMESKVALQLATMLLYDHYEDSAPFIAPLLQNSLMLCTSHSTVRLANGIVNYALHSVLRSESAKSEWPLVQTLLSQESEERVWNDKTLNDVVKCLSTVFPNVRSELCAEALKWAAQCTITRKCIDSLHVFRAMLADKEIKDYVPRLAACLSSYVLHAQTDAIVALGDVVLSLPGDVLKSDLNSLNILIRAFFALLTTGSATVYAVALDVLHMLRNDVASDSDAFVSAIKDMVVDPLSTATLIMRGLLSASNAAGAFWLAGVLVESSVLPNNVKMLVVIETLLSYAVVIHTKDLNAPVLALQFARQAGSRLEKLAEAFAKMDMRNVLVAQQPTSEAVMDQFFAAFSATFGPSAPGATAEEATFAIDAALVLLRNGVKRNTAAALSLCTHFLETGSVFKFSEPQLLHISELAAFFVHTATGSVAENAKMLFGAALEHIPKGATLAFYDLIHNVPIVLHGNEENPDLFTGVTPYDSTQLTVSAVKLFGAHVLASEPDKQNPLDTADLELVLHAQQKCAASAQKTAFAYDVLSSRKGRTNAGTPPGQRRPFDSLSSHVLMGNPSVSSFSGLQ